jgi:hypothetical protein
MTNALEAMEPVAADLAGEVADSEYLRLLGVPQAKALEGNLTETAHWARSWYAAHGRPYLAARRVTISKLGEATIELETGASFSSRALAGRLASSEAHALLALAVSAGGAVDEESRRLWEEERLEESYFLDRFGAAVTRRLVRWATRWYCRRSEPSGETLLPHLSPGCGGWDFEDQVPLLGLLMDPAKREGPLHMLPSGMLTPKNSLLAACGITRRRVAPSPSDVCGACDLSPCSFRRAPHGVGG